MAQFAFTSAVPVGLKPAWTPGNAVCSTRTIPHVAHVPAPARLNMTIASPTSFKDVLLEKVLPLNFGRKVADNKVEQDEIEQLVRQVEATNKSSSPGTDPNLSGVWDMVYTTSTSILGTGKPWFLQATRIVQEINAAELTGRNEESFKFGPFTFTNAVEAKLTPTSANRFDVNFIQFIVFGIFKFNVEKNKKFTGWLEVTYLDEDMRISRGNRGNIFVLIKK